MLQKDTSSFRFITTLPHSIFCIRLRKAVSGNVISSHMEEKQSMQRLKEKALYLWANAWGREGWKNSARCLKALCFVWSMRRRWRNGSIAMRK